MNARDAVIRNMGFRKKMIGAALILGLAGCTMAAVAGPAGAGGKQVHPMMQMAAPGPGLHAFTMAKMMNPAPPDLLGGPVKVSVNQKNGATRFNLPGTRVLDKAIFNTPDQPAGFDPAPFPMLGIDVGMRLSRNQRYTIVDHFCPFSDWYEKGKGSVTMSVSDVTAIDGAKTKDKIDFEANFELPDGAKYRVVVKMPLAHGMAFPTFGGVVTNHLIHGAAGIAPRILPTTFSYVAFWGAGNIYKDGDLINKGQMVHVWVNELIRGKDDRYRVDSEAGNPSAGKTLHMVIPPYRPTPKGMVKTPLKTMFMPFPYVKKNIMKEMGKAKKSGDKDRLEEVKQIKTVADRTKKHIVQATAEGKMFGMPFIFMKFDDIDIKVNR